MPAPRQPVPSKVWQPRAPHPSANSATQPAVPEIVRAPDNLLVDLDSFDADDIAPALSYIALDDTVSRRSDKKYPEPQSHPKVKQHGTSTHHSDRNLPEEPTNDHYAIQDGAEPAAGVGDDGEWPLKRGFASSLTPHAAEQPSGKGGFMLENTEDTTYHRKFAPAVVHETIEEAVHEVRHDVYEREFHEHEVYHRILPVQEVEVLPARHFIQDSQGRRQEVSADRVPGRSPQILDRKLAKVLKPESRDDGHSRGTARDFTARRFLGDEGDYSERKDSQGLISTEQWWIHPPSLEQSESPDGDRYPVHFYH